MDLTFNHNKDIIILSLWEKEYKNMGDYLTSKKFYHEVVLPQKLYYRLTQREKVNMTHEPSS
ncbi:MAG: hypothetical protein BGO67_11190 [Alphaproteobacteria bacterium 41-28]|nr:MAG: hypothetical protein BGO67_11190 [Alphaproteobacteria bacterium 41-28]